MVKSAPKGCVRSSWEQPRSSTGWGPVAGSMSGGEPCGFELYDPITRLSHGTRNSLLGMQTSK